MEGILITFHTTSEALKFEEICPFPGKLVPLPAKVKSGCGWAWLSDVSLKYELLDFIQEINGQYETIVEL